jgi:hypothetical protein
VILSIAVRGPQSSRTRLHISGRSAKRNTANGGVRVRAYPALMLAGGPESAEAVVLAHENLSLKEACEVDERNRTFDGQPALFWRDAPWCLAP